MVVCCLYDIGSPYTFLTQKTLSLIGYKDSTPANAEVEVHGTMLPVSLSHDRFEDIDVLGQNFLCRIGAKVSIDYMLPGPSPLQCNIHSIQAHQMVRRNSLRALPGLATVASPLQQRLLLCIAMSLIEAQVL